jgi:hypothetical protein
MIKVIQHNCTRSYEWTIEAVETGAEHTGDEVCLQEPRSERGGCGISHAVYELRKSKCMLMAIRKRSSIVVDGLPDLSTGASEDVIITDVTRRGEYITWIVNVYNQRDRESEERLAKMVNWESIMRWSGSVCAGGFNAHSSRWDPRCRAQWNATCSDGMIDKNGLEIENDW